MIGLANGNMQGTFASYYGATGNFLLGITGISVITGAITGAVNGVQTGNQGMWDNFWNGFGNGLLGGLISTLTLGVPASIQGAMGGWYNIYSDGWAYLSDASNMAVTLPGLCWGASAMANGGHLSKELSDGSNMFWYTGVDNNFLGQYQKLDYGFEDGTKPGFVIGNTYISGFKDDQLKEIMNYKYQGSKHQQEVDKLRKEVNGLVKLRNDIEKDPNITIEEKKVRISNIDAKINGNNAYITSLKGQAKNMVKSREFWDNNWKKHEYSHVRQIRGFGVYFYADYLYCQNKYPDSFHAHSQWELNAHPMSEPLDKNYPELLEIENY